ncbi:MAG TPA: O-antigen ligase family protein [Acidimicrobiales bacterium]|nr:O-antigen ligase family protein [Acidimicrobiales bacterium]
MLAAAVFITGVAQARAGGFTASDALIGGFVVLAVLETIAGRRSLRPVTVAALLPILLVFAGSLVGTLAVGLRHWVLYDLFRDLGAAAALLAVLQVFDPAPPRWFRLPSRALLAGTVIVGFQLVFLDDQHLRAKATFPNPNLAGHFMATCFMALVVLPVSRPARIVGLTAAGAGVIATGSFGAIVQLVVGVLVLGIEAARRARPATRQLLTFAFAGALALLVLVVASGTRLLPEQGETTGYNADHLDRTTTGRIDLWNAAVDQVVDAPWGIGPGSSRNLEVLREGTDSTETHSEPLAFLAERGALGLLGLVALWATVWGFAVPGGVGRAMIASLVVASLFRETSHYRHLWVLLALVVTYERAVVVARSRRDGAVVA